MAEILGIEPRELRSAAPWQGEEAADRSRGGERAEAGDEAVAAGAGQVVGELVERVLDRGAELLQRGAVVGRGPRGRRRRVSVSSRGRSGRRRRSGRARPPIARAVAAGVARRCGFSPLQHSYRVRASE